jgi:hypothetical protein
MVETILAGAGFVACLVMLLGMALGPRRRARARAAWRHLQHWPQRRRSADAATKQAIERARRAVERDGNVYRPRSFSDRPPDDKLH